MLIPIFLGGVVSSLLPLLLGQPLQHYFWRRQRYAERQFPIIEELNTLVAEVHYLLIAQRFSPKAQESLYKTLTLASGNVRSLFSLSSVQQCQALHEVMRSALNASLNATDTADPEPQHQVLQQLQEAHRSALIALYRDMGIPPSPPAQWIREHAWHPLRVQVWDRPQQYWCTRGWPTLQRWGAQARTKIRRS
jgi:hypothetical protein